MSGLMSLLVLGSSIWMAVDASQLGYDKRDIRGLAAMGPAGWFLAGILLWIVAFPLYLIKRPELKAAGERRRLAQARGVGYLPGAQYGAPQYGQPQYGQPPFTPPQYGQPQYGQPPFTPPYAPPPFGQQPYGPPQSPYAPPAPYVQPNPYAQPPAPLTTDEVADQLVKLGDLRTAGLLTEDEFQQQKAQLLARM